MDDLSIHIRKAQEGDKKAYGEIYNLFYKKIYRYCFYNLGNEDIAFDICQETFLKAWKAIGTFSLKKGGSFPKERIGSFQAFLFRIARNLIIDLSRKHKEVPIETFEETLEVNEDIEGKLEKKDNQKMVTVALESLNEIDRQIVILSYFEEMSGSEVARVLNLKPGAMRVRLHRSLKKLKEKIENDG